MNPNITIKVSVQCPKCDYIFTKETSFKQKNHWTKQDVIGQVKIESISNYIDANTNYMEHDCE